jgi:cytochrome c oxidase subunit IV
MSETIVSKGTYFTVWIALLILLAATVAVSYVQLGFLNIIATIAIAAIKAVIIIMYFMHVRYSPRLVWVFVGAGFFWLSILFALALGDYYTRIYMPMPTDWKP